ncbi:hypothetical protein H0H87_000726 [Tephrocybe sp. NHM501043]|nr:hypothetical protein H0H87_000726 [Tephrocybe sp. NHM501043]
MPKSSKKAPAVATRPISDFFIRKSAPALEPTTAKSPGQSTTPKPTKALPSSSKKSVSISSASISSATNSTITISDASSPTTPRCSSTLVDTVEILSPNRSTMKSQYLKPPVLSVVKRAESVSSRAGTLSPRPVPARTRKTVFDSDSDVEMHAPSVLAFRSSPCPTSSASLTISSPIPLRARENLTPASQTRSNPRKKQRLSSPEQGSELVPTSQSDELEMAPAVSLQRDPRQIKRSVDEWRHNAISVTDDVFDDSPSVPSFDFGCTPPRDETVTTASPIPPSPLALNPNTKAEQIIAEIKARAYTESQRNRPETPVRTFKDELSDSDEDEDDLFPASPMKGKGKSASAMLGSTSAAGPQRRYGLRNHETSPSPSAPKQASGSSVSAKRSCAASSRISKSKVKAKGKAFNPLDEMLKEKKRDDQKGKGSEAFRQAEAALADRDAIMTTAEDEAFTSEMAARQAVTERKGWSLWSSSSGRYDASDEDVNDEDRKRLLGEEQGSAVASLLNRDKVSRLRDREIEKSVGVPFWRVKEDAQDLMDNDQVDQPKLIISTPHPLLVTLQSAVDRNDVVQAALLINSGIMSYLQLADNPAVIPYLCDRALSVDESLLSNSAIQALTHIWGNSLRPVLGLSFACIITTLARLGAQTVVLGTMGWTPIETATSLTQYNRDSVLYRLVSLITTSARFRRLRKEETPDILMAMILVANDPTSSGELQCEIALAIDAICASIASGGDLSISVETSICTKVLNYLSTLEPVNKAYITALFASGCGRTRRIGRWIAHAVITDKATVSPKRYSELPPVLPLLAEFTRQRSDSTTIPGKFVQHDATDFVDMTFYVRILGMAVTNIVGYVMEERKAGPRFSGAKGGAASDPPLVVLRTAIESLHGQISDIRATHLDRSQAKAALKELSLRLHYQRLVAQQNFRSIKTYFSKNKKPNGISS